MTTLRARSHASRDFSHDPRYMPRLHPDWQPPADDERDDAMSSPTNPPTPGDYPRNSISGLAPTASPLPMAPGSARNPTLDAYLAERRRQDEARAIATDPSLSDPALTPDDTFLEPREFHTFPARSAHGRETKLLAQDQPLRHRIYALHCQGRSLSAIARQLRLDRGTVARHLHATEDLLLAEQTDDLARLRLRAVEAQHAILAACWDALLCEELLESDEDNSRPYPPRRAQLLATAARAARTAAQLQGLFTPAALAAALRDTLPAALPAAPTAASCGMPASDDLPITSASSTGLPLEFNSTPGSSATPPAPIAPESEIPAASCGMVASGVVAIAPDSSTGLPLEFNSTALPATAVPASASPPQVAEGLGETSTLTPPARAIITGSPGHMSGAPRA